MIHSNKACVPGQHHIEHEQPCQDACQVVVRDDGVAFAAVADGVGSEERADVGATIAVQRCIAHCVDAYRTDMTPDEKLALMRHAYWLAYSATLLEAEIEGKPADQYDATLCMAIWDGDDLWYGQSGDSGMVALLQSGEYRAVTEQQRDEDGCVYPLCAGAAYWKFDKADFPVSAVLLVTDGLYEQLVPPLLRHEEVKINVPLAERLMNQGQAGEASTVESEKALVNFLENYPSELVNDDMTALLLYDPEKPALRLDDEGYYKPVDWDALMEKALSRLYES